MKRLLALSFTFFAIACGGTVEGKGPNPNEQDGEPPPDVDAAPPPYDEPCGFAGRVNEGEHCSPQDKGMTCESWVQTACVPALPPLICTCNGSTFVCEKPMKCPPTTIDAGKGD
jgi:hypothetical protein